MIDIPDAAVEAAAQALDKDVTWKSLNSPDPLGALTLHNARLAITAALPHLELGINDIALDALALVAERDAEIARLRTALEQAQGRLTAAGFGDYRKWLEPPKDG